MNKPYRPSKPSIWHQPKKIALIVVVVFVLWMLSGIILSAKDKAPEVKANKTTDSGAVSVDKLPIKFKQMQAQKRARSIFLNGVTEPERVTLVEAETEGKVVEIMFDEGESAKKGDVLMRLDIRNRKNKVNEASALLKQREVEYNAAKKLYAKGFYSKVRLSQAESALANARSLLKRARLDLSYTQIRAPYTGVVEEIMVENGDLVGKGFSKQTVLRFVDMSPLKVVGRISEIERANVKIGDKATLRFSTGEVVTGEVSFVASVADKETRTFRVEIEVPNTDRKLQAGVSVEISLQADENMAYEVPSSVLVLDDAGNVGVKILNKNNVVKFHKVDVLSQSPAGVWIGSLPHSINLVVDGAAFVSDGQVISSDSLSVGELAK